MRKLIVTFESPDTARRAVTELYALRMPHDRFHVDCGDPIPRPGDSQGQPLSVFAPMPTRSGTKRTVVSIEADDDLQALQIKTVLRHFGPLDVRESRPSVQQPTKRVDGG